MTNRSGYQPNRALDTSNPPNGRITPAQRVKAIDIEAEVCDRCYKDLTEELHECYETILNLLDERDEWKKVAHHEMRRADEAEAIARVLAEAAGECPVMDCPADRIAPDGKGVCPGGDQDAKCWLTWAREQVRDESLGQSAQSQSISSHAPCGWILAQSEHCPREQVKP